MKEVGAIIEADSVSMFKLMCLCLIIAGRGEVCLVMLGDWIRWGGEEVPVFCETEWTCRLGQLSKRAGASVALNGGGFVSVISEHRQQS